MRLIYVAPLIKNPKELAVTVVKITSMKVPELLWEKNGHRYVVENHS